MDNSNLQYEMMMLLLLNAGNDRKLSIEEENKLKDLMNLFLNENNEKTYNEYILINLLMDDEFYTLEEFNNKLMEKHFIKSINLKLDYNEYIIKFKKHYKKVKESASNYFNKLIILKDLLDKKDLYKKEELSNEIEKIYSDFNRGFGGI